MKERILMQETLNNVYKNYMGIKKTYSTTDILILNNGVVEKPLYNIEFAFIKS